MSTTNTYRQGVDDYTGCDDTYLTENNPTGKYGALTTFSWGYLISPTRRYFPYIKFDISDIPESSNIISAVLSFYRTTPPPEAITTNMHRCKRDWPEMEASWNEWSTGNNWQIGGGHGDDDRDQDIAATASCEVGVHVPLEFDITDLVQSWVDGTYPNYGVGCFIQTQGVLGSYRSSEHATVAERPQLVVEFEEGGEEEGPPAALFGVIGCGVIPFKR